MKRPLGIVALWYGCGLLLGEVVQPPLPLLFSISIALTAGALLISKHRAALLWPALLLTGWTNCVLRTAIISPRDLRTVQGDATELATVRGSLIETPRPRFSARAEHPGANDWHTLAQVQVSALCKDSQWRPVAGRIVVSTPGLLPGEFFAGQHVEISGVLTPPAGPLAEGLIDYRTYLRRNGIYYQLKAQSSNDWQRVAPGATVRPLNDRFLAWSKAALACGLPEEDESLRLEWALSLGDKTVLTEDVAEPFVRASTYHIFAVDGLRMAIVFGILFTLCRALRLPRALGGVVLIPLLWFYTGLTGWPASAIRASLMLTIVIVGWALKRPSDLVNSLFAAALVLLFWDPQQLFQAGFQLSFLVVLGILLALPVLERFCEDLFRPEPFLPDQLRPRWRHALRVPVRHLLGLLLTSSAAWFGSIPLVAYYFHIVTPLSAPANVVAVPLCALVLVSNFISLLLAGWFPAGAELFNHAGWFLMECIRVTSRWFAGLPGACYYVPAPNGFSIGLYYLVFAAVFTGWLFKQPRRAWKLAGLVLLLSIWCWRWEREWAATRVTILPLSGGAAVYCDAPGTRNDLLVDCGAINPVEFVVKPFLRAQGVNRLPCLVLTHGDQRQIGGAELLCTLLPIRHVATSSVPFRSPAYRRILAGLDNSPDCRRVLNRGDRVNEWLVLHPDRTDHFPRADDNALVVFGVPCGTPLLLVSDLGRQGLDMLLERHPELRADIVVAGLPQQDEPVGDALLDVVRPKLVVIADSEFPVSRRASAALRARLERRGIPILYMRDAGAVTVSLRPPCWEARTMSGLRVTGQSGPAISINPN